MDQLDLPRTLAFLANTLGWAWQGWTPHVAGGCLGLCALGRRPQAVFYLWRFWSRRVLVFDPAKTIIVMSRLVEYDLKRDIYGHYQVLDSFYKRHDTGDLMNRISEDVSHVRMYLGPAIMYSMNLVVLVALVVTVMLSIDPVLTLFASALPFMSLGIYFISANIHRKSDARQKAQSRVSLRAATHRRHSGAEELQPRTRRRRTVRRRDGRVQSACARPGQGGSHVHAAHRLAGGAEHHPHHLRGRTTRGGRPPGAGPSSSSTSTC